jgi:hypothetical protein
MNVRVAVHVRPVSPIVAPPREGYLTRMLIKDHQSTLASSVSKVIVPEVKCANNELANMPM